MEIACKTYSLTNKRNTQNATAVLGHFACFHLGHQALLNKCLEVAKNTNTKSVLILIDFSNKYGQIMTLKDKKEYLKAIDFDELLVIELNDEVKNLSKDDFMHILKEQFHITNVVVGEDYHFGFNKSGNVNDLTNNFNTFIIPIVNFETKKISTKDIYNYILDGNVKEANALLGFNYAITGQVKRGKQNGRKIDFKTANININPYVKPKDGVYMSKIKINNKSYFGMTYIGTHKTIDELSTPILEVNIFDFNQNIYRKTIKVELIKRIADEHKFTSLIDLKNHLNNYKLIIENELKNK